MPRSVEMNAEAWRKMIGEDAWRHILKSQFHDGVDPYDATPDSRSGSAILRATEESIADALTAAWEVGFRAPAESPRVAPEGTRVMFPGSGAALTGRGLLRHWRAQGHGWVVFRCDQLARAVAGPLFPRMQEVAAAYEAQCEIDGVTEEMIPGNWSGVVGGTAGDAPNDLIMKGLREACPLPTIQRGTVKGPGV